jgi:hypothetical protein
VFVFSGFAVHVGEFTTLLCGMGFAHGPASWHGCGVYQIPLEAEASKHSKRAGVNVQTEVFPPGPPEHYSVKLIAIASAAPSAILVRKADREHGDEQFAHGRKA